MSLPNIAGRRFGIVTNGTISGGDPPLIITDQREDGTFDGRAERMDVDEGVIGANPVSGRISLSTRSAGPLEFSPQGYLISFSESHHRTGAPLYRYAGSIRKMDEKSDWSVWMAGSFNQIYSISIPGLPAGLGLSFTVGPFPFFCYVIG
jgi:hypothetical protein